jgi:phosphoglycolate phosphatase
MLFVFDWDGTLIDSAAKIVACMRQAALDMQLQELETKIIKDIIGLGLPEAIQTLYPLLEMAGVLEYKQRYSDHFVAADQVLCSLFPGAIDTLNALKAQGHLIAVATGKSRRGLARALTQQGWETLFDATRCADETASKPDPRMLHEILGELRVAPSDAVMIGDTEFDMAMAQNASVSRIAVTYGAHEVERLQRYEPDLCIDHLPLLINYENFRANQLACK